VADIAPRRLKGLGQPRGIDLVFLLEKDRRQKQRFDRRQFLRLQDQVQRSPILRALRLI